MTIENTLERIAVALEAIAAGGAVPTPGKTEAKDKPAKDKPAKDTSSTKAKPTTKAKPKPSEKPESSDGPKISDVRAALGKVQKAFDPETARALLKDVGGAATMSKLDADNYQTVIDAALEKAADAE